MSDNISNYNEESAAKSRKIKHKTKAYQLVIDEKGYGGYLITLGKIDYFEEKFYNKKLSDEVIKGIKNTKELLSHLSYYRKKEELDKIFTSPNYKNGIKLLLELGLDQDLEIPNLSKVLDSNASNLIGIWSILNVTDKYPFNKNELDLIDNINKVMELDNLDPLNLYKYGLYVNSVAGEIKNIDIKTITEKYVGLPIKSRRDIDIDSKTIMELLDQKPGKYLKNIYDDLEEKIIYNELINNREEICKYIKEKY